MSQFYSRTPRQYDGTQITSHKMTDLLPRVLAKIGEVYQQRADLILAMWPEIIGPTHAAMTQAVSFSHGILLVKVKNSTLLSVLSQNDKQRILNLLKQKFPHAGIKNIQFRMG